MTRRLEPPKHRSVEILHRIANRLCDISKKFPQLGRETARFARDPNVGCCGWLS
jgi:hypothetical protein